MATRHPPASDTRSPLASTPGSARPWTPKAPPSTAALREGITGGAGWTSLPELFAKAATDQT
jgi:hypothetical protein